MADPPPGDSKRPAGGTAGGDGLIGDLDDRHGWLVVVGTLRVLDTDPCRPRPTVAQVAAGVDQEVVDVVEALGGAGDGTVDDPALGHGVEIEPRAVARSYGVTVDHLEPGFGD